MPLSAKRPDTIRSAEQDSTEGIINNVSLKYHFQLHSMNRTMQWCCELFHRREAFRSSLFLNSENPWTNRTEPASEPVAQCATCDTPFSVNKHRALTRVGPRNMERAFTLSRIVSSSGRGGQIGGSYPQILQEEPTGCTFCSRP
jgi:hypothetical protein